MIRPHHLAGAAVLLFAAAAVYAASSPPAVSQGWLHVVWDADRAVYPDGRVYLLVRDDGEVVELDVSATSVAERHGFVDADRRRVEVVADALPRRAGVVRQVLRVQSLRLSDPGARAAAALGFAAAPSGAAANAAFPIVTLLCRFADDSTTTVTRTAVERMMNSTYPGMAHYYGELSWDPDVLGGSLVTGWYALPAPRSTYVSGTSLDFFGLARDCTAAADADVFFPAFRAINLQFSGNLSTRSVAPFDTLSFGGSLTLTRDGQTRQYGVTWMSRHHASNYMVLAHELGHAMGWPHSSGRYGQEYDSRWDVMSVGYLNHTQEFGWLSIHTIAAHKDQRGWVRPERRWEPASGTRTSGVITRTALPPTDGSWLMARIPLTGNHYYTVETRRVAGYDTPLPGQAVVMHHVEGVRAYVVDPDNNGNPNDAGAMWMPGEAFVDSIHGVTMRVDSATASGFGVTITRGWELDVVVSGSGGSGRVTGTAPGIDCDNACSAVIAVRGAAVTLTAAAAEGSLFLGWSGPCSGTGVCEVVMNGPRKVTAQFGPRFAVASDSLRRAGVMGATYADTLTVTGESTNATWTLEQGTLPPGVSLDPATGIVSGVPESAGSFHYTARATAGALSASRAFGVSVSKPVLQAQSVLDQLLGTGSLTTDQLRFLDLLGNRNGRLDVGDVRAWLVDNQQLTGAAAASLRSVSGVAPPPAAAAGADPSRQREEPQ